MVVAVSVALFMNLEHLVDMMLVVCMKVLLNMGEDFRWLFLLDKIGCQI